MAIEKTYDHLTIGDMRELLPIKDAMYKDAVPVLKAFKNKHSLTDKQVLDLWRLTDNLIERKILC